MAHGAGMLTWAWGDLKTIQLDSFSLNVYIELSFIVGDDIDHDVQKIEGFSILRDGGI